LGRIALCVAPTLPARARQLTPRPSRRVLSKSTDHNDPIAETRHRALGVRRPAESWIDDDVDFDLKSVRSRTIELSAGHAADAEPAEDSKKRLPKVPSIPRPSMPNVSMPAIPTNTVDLVHGTANQIDKAGGLVADKAKDAADKTKDVADKGADVARVGAEKVNTKRRAGLPPGRDHERRNKPRVTKIAAERRPRKKALDRVGPRPDRIVLWAVILGIVLIFIAATSSSKAATGSATAEPPAMTCACFEAS